MSDTKLLGEDGETLFGVGDVVYIYGSSAILGDIIALDEEEESVEIKWRPTFSTEHVSDHMLCRAEEEDQHPPIEPVVIVTRHPDFSNEYVQFGEVPEVKTIDLDYGASFNGRPREQSELDEWAEGARSEVSDLSEAHPARAFIEEAIKELAENSDLEVPS